MATTVQRFLGLADVYKRTDGMAGVADIMEALNTTSQDIFTDFLMMECNNGNSHRHTIRTGLPTTSWGALYEGTPQSKSSSQQVDDTTGFVEAMSSVDTRLEDFSNGNFNAIRASEGEPFIESMAQELVTALFYHNPATDARLPKGLGARYGKLANSGAGNQIVDAGGTGSDNTSIWFVTWGPQSLFGLYPKGSSAGISQQDMGRQRVLDANGNPYYVYEELYRTHMGFAVKDWRRNVRISNIDVSELKAGNVDLYSFMRKAYWKLHGRRANKVADQHEAGRTVLYANKDVLEALDALGTNAGAGDSFIRLRPTEIEGKEVLSYRGYPIRETDALLNTEARVV